MNQHIVELITLTPRFGMIGKLGIFNQNARLKARTLVFANPGQFKFGFTGH
ncbi:hypothetical protein D3C84_1252950 [compost metagenome]